MASTPHRPALALLTALLFHTPTLITCTQSIKCLSNAWFSTKPTKELQLIPPERINDGYCDCPLDGLDEFETGACAGSMDGMWAGVAPNSIVGGNKYFVCPQQPGLTLALSRVNDGICDCCDGADEKGTNTCEDVCDQVLAEERAARAKLVQDYEVGSKIRSDSIVKYEKWKGENQEKLRKLRETLVRVEGEKENIGQSLSKEKIAFSKKWIQAVTAMVPSFEPLTSMIGKSRDGAANELMTADDLASFIISLCWLAGETSASNVANGRCVPFDRASIDVGILWDHSYADDNSLPPFHYLDTENDASLLEYGDKLISRINGNDTAEWSNRNNNKRGNKKARRQQEMDPEDYGEYMDDDYHYREADGVETDKESQEESKDDQETQDSNGPNPTVEEMVKSRLSKLHLSIIRSIFNDQAKMLLKVNPPSVADEETEEEVNDEASAEGGANDNNEEKEDENNNFDPVAINMVKSTINKRLAGINRGQSAATFASRHIIALMKIRYGNNRSVLDDMQSLAIMTAHHSQISIDDIAELIYTTSSAFRPDLEVDPSTCPATSPWSAMCPPQTVPLQGSTSTFPPKFIVNAASRLCEQRADAITGVCSVQEELDVNNFPTTIPDGYYNYYSPKARDPPDGTGSPFSSVTALFQMPSSLSSLIEGMKTIDESLNSIKKEVDTLERDVGGTDSLKFGVDGELFFLRDTCHKVESGKYEYEVCIFGKATQRDIGQKSGGTNLGNWQSFQIENGVRTLKWSDGTKCWNGPKRSAEVTVTCGGLETRLLTADEPETCRYVFTMESPIGCDNQFKLNNSL